MPARALSAVLVLGVGLGSALTHRRAVRAAGGPGCTRSAAPSMVFSQRTIDFSYLRDEGFCMFAIQRIAEAVCQWDAEDWAAFNAPPARLKLDARASQNFRAVVIEFAGWGGQGRDGGLEIQFVDKLRNPFLPAASARQLVFTTSGSRRLEAENVLYELVLEEMRKGSLSTECRIAPGLYPHSTSTALIAANVQNRRLRRELDLQVQQSS